MVGACWSVFCRAQCPSPYAKKMVSTCSDLWVLVGWSVGATGSFLSDNWWSKVLVVDASMLEYSVSRRLVRQMLDLDRFRPCFPPRRIRVEVEKVVVDDGEAAEVLLVGLAGVWLEMGED